MHPDLLRRVSGVQKGNMDNEILKLFLVTRIRGQHFNVSGPKSRVEVVVLDRLKPVQSSGGARKKGVDFIPLLL